MSCFIFHIHIYYSITVLLIVPSKRTFLKITVDLLLVTYYSVVHWTRFLYLKCKYYLTSYLSRSLISSPIIRFICFTFKVLKHIIIKFNYNYVTIQCCDFFAWQFFYYAIIWSLIGVTLKPLFNYIYYFFNYYGSF